MDFELTKEQRDIRKAAEDFAKGEFDPDLSLEYDAKAQFPASIWQKACELGFVGSHFPEQYGGADFGQVENALIAEAFCRQDSTIGMALALSDFGSGMILRHGNEEQKKKALSPTAAGEAIGTTLAFLEEGYSLAPMATTAHKNQAGYLLQGKKTFVPFAGSARYILVVCQVNPENPYAQTVFLMDRETAGIQSAGMGETLGMRMIPLDQITLAGAKIPEDAVVGGKEKGHAQLKGFLIEHRIEAGAIAVGIAQGAFDRGLEYSKKREAFGKMIVRFDAIRNKLADMYLEVEMARLITYKAAWSFDQGKIDQGMNLLAKMIPVRAARRVASDAIQIYGGAGYMKEEHVERFFRDARVLDLFIEHEQMQRNKIADYITGGSD
jgi:alkylation response protein AidB-like acyl-CoA dehydrogenase